MHVFPIIVFFPSITLIIASHQQGRMEPHFKPEPAKYSKKHVPEYLAAPLILLNANNN